MLRMTILIAAVAALCIPSTALAQDAAPIDPATIAKLLEAHSWAALAAVVIPLLLHLAQRGVYPLGLTIPPAVQPALVTVLSIAAGVADAVASGTSWRPALVGGVAAALVALRLSPPAAAPDGQPQANPSGAAPDAPREAPMVPPVVGGLLLVLGGLVLAGALTGCTPAAQATAARVGGGALAAVDGPACELVEVRSGSALAGVVCEMAAGALERYLASVGSTSQALTSSGARPPAARCRLVPVHAGGQHQGFVCAEHEGALVAALARDGGAGS